MSDDFEPMKFPHFKTYEMEMEIKNVDPDVLELLTGMKVINGKFLTAREPVVSLEFWTPIKRTFWQWLRRKPIERRYFYLPRVAVTKSERGE